MAIVGESLEHEGGAAKLQPAPAQLFIHDPLVLDGEAEAIDIETQGAIHVGDSEEWHDLLDVGTERRGGIHQWTSSGCGSQWEVLSLTEISSDIPRSG